MESVFPRRVVEERPPYLRRHREEPLGPIPVSHLQEGAFCRFDDLRARVGHASDERSFVFAKKERRADIEFLERIVVLDRTIDGAVSLDDHLSLPVAVSSVAELDHVLDVRILKTFDDHDGAPRLEGPTFSPYRQMRNKPQTSPLDPLHPTHIRPEHFGHDDAAVGLLIVL